jgi:hypothetical protein
MSPQHAYINTTEAVARLVADISDQEVIHPGETEVPFAVLAWSRRERAIILIRAALCDLALAAWVRLATGALVPLIGTDWRMASLWRETILGGVVRTLPEDRIVHYEGGEVLLCEAAFEAWRLRRLAPPADVEEIPVEEAPAEEPTIEIPEPGKLERAIAALEILDQEEEGGVEGTKHELLFQIVSERIGGISPAHFKRAKAEYRKRKG